MRLGLAPSLVVLRVGFGLVDALDDLVPLVPSGLALEANEVKFRALPTKAVWEEECDVPNSLELGVPGEEW